MTDAGVVVAMRWEARGLEPLGDRLRVAGPGPERAAHAAHGLVDDGAEALMSWGVAAGLAPGMAAGQLLLPERVVSADGHHLAVDTTWHTRALTDTQALAPQPGCLAETPSLLAQPADKAALHARTGALAGDMESAAVVRVAHTCRLPVLVVRVVLDPASATVPLAWAGVVGPNGRLRPGRLMLALLRPHLWAHGWALGRYRASAAATLEAVARRLSSHLQTTDEVAH